MCPSCDEADDTSSFTKGFLCDRCESFYTDEKEAEDCCPDAGSSEGE